jgi:hypothetical protein
MFDFPVKIIILKRSDIVAARIPPSNERLDEFFACTFYLMDVQEVRISPTKFASTKFNSCFRNPF